MKTELDAMQLNKTWFVVPLPAGKHTIRYRWIYKIKYKPDGLIDRHKAWLVAKGYGKGEISLILSHQLQRWSLSSTLSSCNKSKMVIAPTRRE